MLFFNTKGGKYLSNLHFIASILYMDFSMRLPSSHSYLNFIYIILLHLILFLAVCFKTKVIIKLPPNVEIPAVLVFGDSIMDTGNNNYKNTIVRCNFAPYGKDFPGGIATGRFSN